MLPLAQAALPAASTATGVDVNQIANLSNGNPLMVLVLGAVAVLGGKKIWDLWQKRQELKHEERMEELKSSKTGHEACVAKQQELESALTGLKSKISDIEVKSADSQKKVEEIVSTSESKLEELRGKVSKLKKKIVVNETAEEKKKPKK